MFTAIFDLDGTLADTSGDLLEAANSQFKAAGFEPPLTNADRNTALLGGMAMLRLGAERLGLDSEFIDRSYEPLLRFYEENIANKTKLYQGTEETLQNLKDSGWKLAICTNKPIHLAKKLIEELGATSFFEVIVGVNSIPERKPAPEPIYHLLDLINGDLDRTILIGDSTTDYQTAQNAGIDILLVDFDHTSINKLHPDAPVVKSFKEAETFLFDWSV